MVKLNAGCAQISCDLYINSLPWAFVGQIHETMLNLKLNCVNMTVWKLNVGDNSIQICCPSSHTYIQIYIYIYLDTSISLQLLFVSFEFIDAFGFLFVGRAALEPWGIGGFFQWLPGFQAYNPRLTHTKEDFILLMDEFFGLNRSFDTLGAEICWREKM